MIMSGSAIHTETMNGCTGISYSAFEDESKTTRTRFYVVRNETGRIIDKNLTRSDAIRMVKIQADKLLDL
jgi:hypothetical protein